MAAPRLLNAIRDELIAAGLVRKPSVGGSAPPLWLEPLKGTPAPGEAPSDNPVEIGDHLVAGLFLTNGVAQPPYSTLRQPIVDFRIRTAPNEAYLAEDFEQAVLARLGDERAWTMGGLYVIESQQWRPLQRLSSGPQGYEHLTSFWFQLLR